MGPRYGNGMGITLDWLPHGVWYAPHPWQPLAAKGERSKDLVKRISEDAMKKLASLTDAGRSHWDQTIHFFKRNFGNERVTEDGGFSWILKRVSLSKI